MRRLIPALGMVLGAAAATAVPGAALGSPPAPATQPGAAPDTAGAHGPAFSLLSQTPWVGPGQTMQIRLEFSGAPMSSLELTVSVYDHLTTRSAFAETAGGTPVGAQLASTTVNAAGLAPDPQGGSDVTIAVSSGDASAAGNGTLDVDLDCAPGDCGGVYPVRLQLSSSGGATGPAMFTYLVYAHPPADTQKLRVAWAVSLSLPPSASAGGDSAQPLAPGALDQLAGVAGALADHVGVGLTLVPEPASITALAASPQPAARSLLGQLQSAVGATGRQTVTGSYVPVDAAALVSSGLGGELGAQAKRAQQVLSGLHPDTSTWLDSGAMSQGALDQLASLGFTHLVVPAADVTTVPPPSLTVTSPFLLPAGHGSSVSAAQADAELDDDVAAGTGSGAVAAAYRFLADLALVYYEQPNDPDARGVVVMDPEAAPDAAFLDAALGALSTDPLVTPVTLDGFFDSTATSAGFVHRLASPSGAANLPVRQIRTGRQRLSAFTASVSAAAAPVVRALEDQLLLAEDSSLRSSQQQQAAAMFDDDLDRQLSTISIRAATLKLTSTAAKVPVTLVKSSAYDLSGTFEVSGDKVVFSAVSAQAPGSVCHDVEVQTSAGRSTFSCQALIDHSTNPVYVAMRARVSGNFRLTITLTSPSGGLVLAQTEVTVRSVSTSLVAVGLSAAALAVLLLWWGRTLWRGGGRRRGAHVRQRPASDEPAS